MKAAYIFVIGKEVEKQESLIALPEGVETEKIIKCEVLSVGPSCPEHIKRAKLVMFDKRNGQRCEDSWFISYKNILAFE